MKITFNILNQKYGGGPFATLINAMGDILPDEAKVKTGLPDGFVTYTITEQQVVTLCSFFSLGDYWSVIDQVCDLCIGAEPAEVSNYGKVVSRLEGLEVRVRASNAVRSAVLPNSWPNATYQDLTDPDNPLEANYNLEQWAGDRIDYLADGASHVLFKVINRFADYALPDAAFFKVLKQWQVNNPALEITFQTAADYVTIRDSQN